MSDGSKFTSGVDARNYVLAGNARVTLVSEKTGTRFTFKIRKGRDKAAPWFVAVLTGSNNETDYVFFGTIFPGSTTPHFAHSRKSIIGPDAPSARAWAWAWKSLSVGELPKGAEVWHEGTCGRCGRALTVPESIAAGLGPECAQNAKWRDRQ